MRFILNERKINMADSKIIRQAAFEPCDKMLKGGLHCHTTRSDGKGEPDEVERYYAAHGYDFLAITDHRRYNRVDFAPDAGLLIIPGMEFDADFELGIEGFRCYHTVCLGVNDESNGFSHDEEFESGLVENQAGFQKYLDWIHSKNNLTFYCHPEWSSTPTRYFNKLKGEFAMEIWNSGCAIENDMDTNAAYWDEMIGLGHKIWGVAVDDGHPMNQHCNGWVMVNAEKNDKAVLDALLKGAFYSSCGPTIKDFYIEDGVAHIECSECAKILFHADRHPTAKREAVSGEMLTHAQLDLRNNYRYVRVCVVDADGKRAWTNPIFIK